MPKIKYISLILLLFLLSACSQDVLPDTAVPVSPTASLTTPLSAAPVADTPTAGEPIENTPEPGALPQPGGMPEQVGKPQLISVGYNGVERVIPTYLDPLAQPQEVVAQYRAALADPASNLVWFAGTLNGTFSFDLGVSLQPGSQIPVTLDFPVQVSITLIDSPVEGLNLIFMPGGGGGVTLLFSPFKLFVGDQPLLPAENASVELRPSQQEDLIYHMQAACDHPGVYALEFRIPYRAVIDGSQENLVLPFVAMLACPHSANLWLLKPDSGSLERVNSIKYQEGQYVSEP